jgi:tRNA A-37 threonylcarbamoyl transferase component Bud32
MKIERRMLLIEDLRSEGFVELARVPEFSLSAESRERIIEKFDAVLATLHRAGWGHGEPTPLNVFCDPERPERGVRLIDFEKMAQDNWKIELDKEVGNDTRNFIRTAKNGAGWIISP